MDGNRLKSLRKEKKLTQEQLAKKLKITQSAIASLENNRRNAGSELEKSIADFFQVSIDYLNGLTDDKKSSPNNRESLVSNFLKYLIENDIIEDTKNIDKHTEDMIMNMVKKEIALIKGGK
ncbi:helix-turn-helix domain-containing protein [Clostridium butyricum]|uniref:helix-turn-helix domain-containing protein n=1 Tax=Clostridium butyricum TaxID=1492 RepID=UPI003D33A781